MRVYKNVERETDTVFISFHPPPVKFNLGEIIESDKGISCYLKGSDAQRGSYSTRKDSYTIELTIDPVDRITTKKHFIYGKWLIYVIVYEAIFTRVIELNEGG